MSTAGMLRMPRLSKASYNLMCLGDHHRHMVRLLHGGMRPKDVAEVTGVTTATVRNARHCDLGREAAMSLHGVADEKVTEISRHIAEAAMPAVLKLRSLIASEDTPPAVALGAAKDVLDRAGHQATHQVTIQHQHITAKLLADIKAGAATAGITVDVTPTQSEEQLLPETRELLDELALTRSGEETPTDVEAAE